jgi:hypothetical protein
MEERLERRCDCNLVAGAGGGDHDWISERTIPGRNQPVERWRRPSRSRDLQESLTLRGRL